MLVIRGKVLKKKILFLIHDMNCGGAERALVNLVNNLNQDKYDITVQSLFDIGKLRDEFNANINYVGGFKKMFRGNVTLSKQFTPERLCKMFIRENYDLVVSFLEGQCCRILSAYDGKKIAWIHVEHRSAEEITRPFRNFKEAKKCYSKFDKIVCVAKTVESNFNSYFHLENKTKVIYNVIDKETILKKSKESQNLIKPSENCFNIVSVGKLVNNHKGFDRLIRIHYKLQENGINNKLYIIGEGEDRKKLESMITDDSVFITGFVDNPYKYVKAADLFVCSSQKEGYSTAVTEALILGVPVISTDVSGARELINNNCGVVCENNELMVFKSIKETIVNKALYNQYKNNAVLRSKTISLENSLNDFEILIDY